MVGERGEYLLQLDDGAAEDPDGEAGVFFDHITDETFNYLQNNQETSSYVTLLDYLTATGRQAPEKAFYLNYVGTSAFNAEEAVVPELTEPKDIRREITNKLLKSMYMHFNAWGNKRRRTLEEVLNAHTTGRRTFWEVYSGDGILKLRRHAVHFWNYKMQNALISFGMPLLARSGQRFKTSTCTPWSRSRPLKLSVTFWKPPT